MASATNTRCPYKFRDSTSDDTIAFIEDFATWVKANDINPVKAVATFRCSLEGEALTWLRTLEQGLSFEEILLKFRKRFLPANLTLKAISDLSEARLKINENVLNFLDKVKLIAIRGGLPEDVLIAFSLNALPGSLAQKIISAESGIVTWNKLYETCSYWNLLKEDLNENKIECNAIKKPYKKDNYTI